MAVISGVDSAGITLGTRIRIGYGMNHWDLLNKPAVYDQIARWLR
jgi:hypothetical protein